MSNLMNLYSIIYMYIYLWFLNRNCKRFQVPFISHCIAETLLFRRRKKASYSELDSLFNADQSQGYFEVYP